MKWNPPETAPLDGNEVVLRTTLGIVSAWFHDESPSDPSNDDGHYEWVCYDDKFQIEPDGGERILGWLPISLFEDE